MKRMMLNLQIRIVACKLAMLTFNAVILMNVGSAIKMKIMTPARSLKSILLVPFVAIMV